MRPLLGVLAALIAGPLLLAIPAAASCAPPASVAENAGRAVAVVYGMVTETGPGALLIRVDRILKGQVGTSLRVFVGPGRGGDAGAPMATSVDYTVRSGTDHVLYLIRGSDGQLETNACIGSHAGPPDAAETAFFGTTKASPPATPAPAAAEPSPPPTAAPIWLLVLLAGVGGGAVIVLLRRRRPLAQAG